MCTRGRLPIVLQALTLLLLYGILREVSCYPSRYQVPDTYTYLAGFPLSSSCVLLPPPVACAKIEPSAVESLLRSSCSGTRADIILVLGFDAGSRLEESMS
ncbi:hypothetical protein HDV57DRAFT_505444 [Trichoderma longibrachiatum]